jgi:hypothetical protein
MHMQPRGDEAERTRQSVQARRMSGDLQHLQRSGVRKKMDLRGRAAILLCDAAFSGYAGYWFLSIGDAVLFVCDSLTVIDSESAMPFRDPRGCGQARLRHSLQRPARILRSAADHRRAPACQATLTLWGCH